MYCGYPDLPLSDDDWEWYTNEEQEMAKEFPIDMSKLDEGNFQQWALDGFELSKTYVYPGKFYDVIILMWYDQKVKFNHSPLI